MKKILTITMIFIILVLSIMGCGKKETENKKNTTKNGVKVEQLINEKSDKKLSVIISKNMFKKCDKKIRSSFEDKYYEITFFLKDTNYNLFTIYYCENENYKEFENKKNYDILKETKNYTIIWYEYGYVDIDGDDLPKELNKFATEYKAIKSSLLVE